MNRLRICFLSLIVLHAHSAFAECLLDPEHFEREAKALASRHAGAEYLSEELAVRWHSKDLGKISVTVGGCEHFLLQTISERSVAQPSSRDVILAVAKRLALVGWPKPYGSEAGAILSRKPIAITREAGEVTFEYAHPDYDEFMVSQSFSAGVETISVRAIHVQ
ncbi:hypothetical protein ACXZ1M_18050 [Duganella sp. PWIR1]